MKKVIYSILITGMILIGSITGASAFEVNTNIEVPDGEKRVKKGNSRTNKKGSDAKDPNINQSETETSETQEAQSTSKDNNDYIPNTLDCTKKGFDRE